MVNQCLSRYSERYILDMFWEENSNELFTAASIKSSESRKFLLSKIFLLSLEKVDLIENSDVAVFY